MGTLRAATPDDALSLAAIHVAVVRALYRGIVPAQLLTSLDLAAEVKTFARRISDAATADERIWVSLEDDEDGESVAGFVVARGGPRPEVPLLCVEPGSWRRGHGRALLAAAVAHLEALGHHRLEIYIAADCARTRRFLAALGFAEQGREVRPFAGVPLEHVRLTLALPR
jgi:GNAT superfamily N-acetyltransferase